MIGVERKNSDRRMFIRDGQLISKAPGNINQGGSEKNDWVQGDIGDNKYSHAAKFKGGHKKDPANYDSTADLNRSDYEDF